MISNSSTVNELFTKKKIVFLSSRWLARMSAALFPLNHIEVPLQVPLFMVQCTFCKLKNQLESCARECDPRVGSSHCDWKRRKKIEREQNQSVKWPVHKSFHFFLLQNSVYSTELFTNVASFQVYLTNWYSLSFTCDVIFAIIIFFSLFLTRESTRTF